MLSWTVFFFILAIIAGVLGFSGIAAASAGIAKICFFIFIVLFAASILMKLAKKGDAALK